MSYPHRQRIIIAIMLFLPALLIAEAPPPNTLPIIVQRPNWDDIDIELFCLLSWMHFDGIHRGDYTSGLMADHVVPPAMETGMYLSLAPGDILRWGHWSWSWAGRISEYAFGGDSPYGGPIWRNTPISDSVYMGPDTLLSVYTAVRMDSLLDSCATVIASNLALDSCVWFYTGFNEAPAHQWNHMVHDSTDGDYYHYDDYIPSMFTQDRDSLYRADLDSTLYLPTLEAVDPQGVVSWLKYSVEAKDSTRELTNTISVMHTFLDWAGKSNAPPDEPLIPPTFADQAQTVRSLLSMEYQAYSTPPIPQPEDNAPDFFLLNCYPFRQVGIKYQEDSSYAPALGDSLNTWLLEHFEEGIDSTFITAWQYGLNEERDVSFLFNPQAFGRVGGLDMWDVYEDILDYGSYTYRIPTPAEYLMSCNTALLRQAKGFSPHCLMSYHEGTHSEAGLLDNNNIPFDAPYEEWVYHDRLRSDFYVIPPDSYPPFIDSPYDFDPLYDLPDRPIAVPGWERNRENYLLWKFKPYARLWNSMRSTNGQIATVAPELSSLWWWEGREYDAEIVSGDSINLPVFYVTPEIRVFTDTTESIAYLFYVSRYRRTGKLAYLVSADEDDFPSGVITEYLLDHSRRFIIPVADSSGEYSWMDTLEAGQGRLVEFVNGNDMDADIRITDPDIVAFYPGTVKKTLDFEFTAGDDIDIIAVFYNMSTDSSDGVIVTCTDLTEDEEIDRDTLDFDGLSTSGWICDSDIGKFTWETDSTDIGVHILEMHADPVSGEPDTLDNTATAVFLIQPRDYATSVLDDPWDMTEDKVDPPEWHTSDIDTLIGWSMDSTLTDSISGMFEGVIPNPSDTNRVYLNVHDIKPIEPDRFYMLNLAGIAMERSLSVYLGWRNEEDSVYVVDTGIDIGTDWVEAAPVSIDNISGDWDNDDIKEIWLEFRGSSLPTSIRLGWVRMTE